MADSRDMKKLEQEPQLHCMGANIVYRKEPSLKCRKAQITTAASSWQYDDVRNQEEEEQAAMVVVATLAGPAACFAYKSFAIAACYRATRECRSLEK